MSPWQFVAACAVGAPGLLLGVLLAWRRQWVVGGLLFAVGLLPFSVLAPEPNLTGSPPLFCPGRLGTRSMGDLPLRLVWPRW